MNRLSSCCGAKVVEHTCGIMVCTSCGMAFKKSLCDVCIWKNGCNFINNFDSEFAPQDCKYFEKKGGK